MGTALATVGSGQSGRLELMIATMRATSRFHHEYHHKLPICHDGEIVFVPEQAYLALIFSRAAGTGSSRSRSDPLRCA